MADEYSRWAAQLFDPARTAEKPEALAGARENFVSGTMDEWGLGYRQLSESNPRLIYVALTGFGQWGPHSHRAGFDAIAQAVSGLASIIHVYSRYLGLGPSTVKRLQREGVV